MRYFKNSKNNAVQIYSFFYCLMFILIAVLAATVIFTGCTPKIKVNLYFGKYEDNQTYLAPEEREIPKDANLYKNIIEELIKGPVSEQLYPTLPSNTKVNSLSVENGLAVVDFSKEIITNTQEIPHSSTTEILAIFSIVDTLTEFEEIQEVRITVEGKKEGQIDGMYIEDFWGHVGIYEDFTRNEEILTKGTVQ
ncbi:MAG: GerMN domain-containing protein [Actinobacteria bacterium]|nr:GerMN domain-containing protein [Actinomycetota bacterium]